MTLEKNLVRHLNLNASGNVVTEIRRCFEETDISEQEKKSKEDRTIIK